MSENRADTSGLQNASTSLKSLKTDIFTGWTGSAASSLSGEYENVLNSLTQVTSQIDQFNVAVAKLEIYKANKMRIEELEGLIANERANPSKKTYETVTTLGIQHTRTVYVVDEAKIANWQNEINELTEKNLVLRNEINAIIASITGVSQGVGSLAINPLDQEQTQNLENSINSQLSSIDNLLPKNNSDISHRGYRTGGMTDNSIDSYRQAGEKGFWGLEADVRFDSNGNLVCSHNAVKQGQNPPSFGEYLDICKEYGMTAIIDLKYEKGVGPADDYLSPSVIKTIEEKGMINSCVIQTNNTTDIPYIRQTSSDARIWYLTDVISDKNIQIINDNNVECVNIKAGDNNAYQIQKLKANGTNVCVWNVFTEDSKNQKIKYGADYVMSDNVLGITPYQSGEKDVNGIAN